jgi:TRAP transporter TAXI family solute receptor
MKNLITKNKLFSNSLKELSYKDILIAAAPIILVLAAAFFVIYKYVNPAPPHHIVISTSDGEGGYQVYAKQYADLLKEDGVTLELRPSTGAMENLQRLSDPNSDVQVGFVQDGLGNPDQSPDLESLGSLSYEPIWIFYRGKTITRFSDLIGKRVAVGQDGGGTQVLALQLLKASGVDATNTKFLHVSWDQAADAVKKNQADAAFFLGTPDEPLIKQLLQDPSMRLMSVDQAEALTRQMPFLHHLVLPHGTIDLQKNIPEHDVDLVSPTATLLVKDTLHPALAYLLLKAANQIHGDPGIFERKNEFPIDKDYEFPLSDEAKSYFKSGTPFWQRYLPFWLAILVERFILIVIPLIALILPLIRLIPRFINWRVRSRIYQQYGELKYLETLVQGEKDPAKIETYLKRIDGVEEKVNHLKLPVEFAEHIYVLREHIDFVRKKIQA